MESLDALVRAVQEGDAEVFNRIVERFQDMACASAYAMIGDVHLAEDVAQEAFLEAYLNLAKLREPAAFSSWFRRILFKQADRLTRGKCLASSSLEVVTDVLMDGCGPTEIAEINEVREGVRCAISELPERERLVVVLFYGTGYTLKDIAAFLEVPVTTVKKRLYDARQWLKDELIDVMRDVLQEQRPSIIDTFPARVRLLLAARLGNIDTVKELLAQSPMLLNMKTGQGEVRYRRVLSVVPGFTVLHEAAMNNHARLAQLLLDYGANCNARTSYGLTPLHGSVFYHCHETAAVLLAHGVNAELPLSNGLTALHLAAMKGDVEMVRLLLAHGASVDCRSRYARTPLHWAALKGHGEVVHLLLAHGSEPGARDATGRTSYDWAIVRENRTIAMLLSGKENTMTTNSIPVGSAVMGRVLNANGEPIDLKGNLDSALHLPLYAPDALSARSDTTSTRVLETGIKVLDLMAPVSYGSIIGMMAGFGLGRVVVVEEIMHTFITRHQAVIVVAGMSETTYDTSSLRDMVREIEAEESTVMVFEQTNDAFSVRQRLLRTAMTIAAHFDGAGREVLLIVDSHLIVQENIADLQQFAAAKGITSMLLVPMNDNDQPADSRLLSECDVQWWFSRARAKQNLWPAVDPLASRSRVLESNVVSKEHREVAQRVHDTLQRYYELREQAGSATLSDEDRLVLVRGERIALFFTQPFVVAEAYTDLPGTYLTIEETISSFRALLDGRYDAVPAQSFNFVGKIDQG